MNIDPYILSFSALTVIATIYMGFWSARKSKTASDFFVAGRSVSVGWNASAISGEYLSAASFMGIAGMVMSSGYDSLWYPVCYACGYLFLLLFIAGPLRRFGAYTIPDFAEGRFDSPLFRKIAVVFVLFIGFFYTMPQMKGAGTTLAYIFQDIDLRGVLPDFLLGNDPSGHPAKGLPYWAGVVLVGAVITLNVALGGMKGITLVQAFQYWAKMFAISVPIFVLMAVYGHYGRQVGINDPKKNAAPGFNFHTLESEFNPMPRPPRTLAQIIADARNKADLMLHGRRRPTGTIPAGMIRFYEADATQVLQFYQELAGCTVLKPDAPPMGYPKVSYTNTVALTVTQAIAEVEAVFTKIDWGFVPVDEHVTIVAPRLLTNEVAQFVQAEGIGFRPDRAPLPPKAPADSTWLNPFGPLTTKAAKNAAAAIVRKAGQKGRGGARGQASAESIPPAPLHPFPLSPIPLRPDITPDQHMTVNLDRPTVVQGLGIYAKLTGRQLLPNTNSLPHRMDDLLGGTLSKLKIISRSPQADTGVREHADGFWTAVEVKSIIEANLRSNGIVLVPAGAKYFRALELSKGQFSVTAPMPSAERGITIDPEKFPKEFSKVVVSMSFGGPVGDLKNAATRWGVGQVSEKLPTPFCPLDMALDQYTRFRRGLSTHFTNYFDRAVGQAGIRELDTASVMPPSLPTSAGTFTDYIERVFKTNGLILIHVNENAVALVLTENLQRFQPRAIAAGSPLAAPIRGVEGGENAEKAWLAKHEKPLALLYTYSLIIAIVCGTAGLPHILVRFYTNPDGVAAKRTTMWVMILIGVFYLFPPVFGVIGRNLMPDLYAGVGAKGTDKIVLELPRILNTKYAPLGSILSGITCAGAFAAFMSTFSGLLVSMTGALAHDVYGRILRPKSTPEQRMKMFKIGAVILGGVAIVLGSFVEKLEINFMVGQAFAIAASSYFPLLFMAVWWRKLTMKGAAAGMLAGGLLAMVAISLTSFSTLAAGTDKTARMFSMFKPLNPFWAEHPLARILCEQPAIWAVPLAITLMIVVSKLTRREVPGDIRMKMLVLHAPEQLGLKQEYIQEHGAH